MSRQGSNKTRAMFALMAVFVAAAGSVTGTAHAAGPLPPANVSAPAAQSNGGGACGFLTSQPGIGGVDVAANARGDTIVSWTRNAGGGTQIVQATFRPAGGSCRRNIGAMLPAIFFGILGSAPDVAIDGNGGGAIVFPAAGGGGNTVIRAAIKPAGGAFGAAVDLSNDAQDADPEPHVAMGASGAAVAVWSRSNGANSIVQAVSRAPGQSFGSTQDLSATLQNATNPRVAVNDAGAASVAWVRSNGANTIAQARVRPAGQAAFLGVQDLSATGQNASAPDVVIDPAGRATVAWVRPDGTQDRVQSRFLTAAGRCDLAPASTTCRTPGKRFEPQSGRLAG